jgi:hypothetical protein
LRPDALHKSGVNFVSWKCKWAHEENSFEFDSYNSRPYLPVCGSGSKVTHIPIGALLTPSTQRKEHPPSTTESRQAKANITRPVLKMDIAGCIL